MTEENSNQVPPTNKENESQDVASEQPVQVEQSAAGAEEMLTAVPVQQTCQPYGGYYGYGQPYGQPYQPYYGYGQPYGAAPRPQPPVQPQPVVEEPAKTEAHAATEPKAELKAKKRGGLNAFVAGFAGAAVAFIACVGGFALWSAFADDTAADDTAAIESTDATDDDSDDSTVVLGATETTEVDAEDVDVTLAEAVAAKCLPSVCSIDTYVYESTYYSYYGYSSSSSDDDELVEYALGSGVVLTEDGYILTNYHVIEDSDYIEVTIEGVTYEAEVIGYDASSDIAVIKAVDASGLTPIEIGDSDDLNVGEWVMSIGSPFGLEQSVATGVVSAVSRSMILESEDEDGTYSIYTNMIQTDAAINPGNSGGALVNADGQLIGINTLIESYSGSYSGVGFAIPVNYAISIAEQIIAGETPTHAQLGVSLMSVTSTLADRYGLSVDEGAYVTAVSEGSAAEEAGIEEGDIIVSLNGESVESATDLMLLVRSNNPGDTVTIELVRDGETITLEVTLGSDEEDEEESDDSTSDDATSEDDDSTSDDDSSGGSGSMLDNLENNSGNSGTYGSGPNSGMGNGFGGMSYDAEDTEDSTEEETVYTS